jgi:hypothetical protein
MPKCSSDECWENVRVGHGFESQRQQNLMRKLITRGMGVGGIIKLVKLGNNNTVKLGYNEKLGPDIFVRNHRGSL